MASSSTPPAQESKMKLGWQHDLLLSKPVRLHALNRQPALTAAAAGYSPIDRPIDRYLRFGIINVDIGASGLFTATTYEIEKALKIEGAKWDGMAGTTGDGNCIGYLGGYARTLILPDREHVCDVVLDSNETMIREAVNRLIRSISFMHDCVLLAYFPDKHLAKFRICCGHETTPGYFFMRLGEDLGVKCTVVECTNGGLHGNILGKDDNMVTLQHVVDAQKAYEKEGDDSYLKDVVLPLEALLLGYKRIMVNDSGVLQICGVGRMKSVTVNELLKFEEEIESGEEVVLITANGEAIAIGFANVDSKAIETGSEDLVVATITKVIMDDHQDADPASSTRRHRRMSRNRSSSPQRFRRYSDISEGRGGRGSSRSCPPPGVSVPRRQRDPSSR